MSEAGAQRANAILLPQSSVVVFAQDKATLKAAKGLLDDWCYARVDLQVVDADVPAATVALAEMASPDLVIIQTENIDDGFTDQLEALANNCDEGTAAIVIGPVNDVNLYRTLIDMGVSDYLVRPVTTDVLNRVVARTLIQRMGVSDSRLIAFVGAKGGVGVSAMMRAAACCTSDLMGQKTVLLDASGGWSTMSVGIGFEPTTTLPEAVKALKSKDEDSFQRMIFEAGDNMSVLATGGDIMLEDSIDAEQVEMIIDHLMVKYPVVLVDLSHTPISLINAVVSRAHQVQVISTASLVSLRLARSLVHEIKELRGGKDDVIELVVNMCGQNPDLEVSKGDIAAAMETEIASIVPYAPKVFMGAESESRKVTDHKDGHQIVQNYLLPILSGVVANKSGPAPIETEKTGLLGGILGRKRSG